MERECTRNIELMWLMGNLTPHFKTIANFRKESKKAIEQAFRRFSLICDELGLVGKEMVAVDGSKFRANNGRGAWYNKKKIANSLAYYRASAEKYIQLLESFDKEEDGGFNGHMTEEECRSKLEHLFSWIDELEKIEQQVEEHGEASLTDPNSRLMKMNNGGCGVCYNVQIAVDSMHHLVVAMDVVSDPGDKQQLSHISGMAKEAMGVDKLISVADKGYYSASEFVECEKERIIPLVSKPDNEKSAASKGYGKAQFHYDAEQDAYVCPQGHSLYGKMRRPSSKTLGIRYCNPPVCKNCLVKSRCTTDRYRCIFDRPFQRHADEIDRNTKANMPLYKKRQEPVEALQR